MQNINAQAIRATSFAKHIPLDQELTQLALSDPSNQVLANPPLQNVYLFLVDYICSFAEQWFKKPISRIRVLDWGCGKGHISHMLLRRGTNLTSADRYDESDDSSFGQNTPIIDSLNIQVIPLQHDSLLPFDDESFDVVISMGVLEHVPDDLTSLREINRVLSQKGLLFCFFLPYYLSWTQRLEYIRGVRYHDRLYSKQSVDSLLNKSNFRLLDFWHRQLFPKNRANYGNSYRRVEKLDQWLNTHTPLRHFSTNIEFICCKDSA